MEKPKPDIDPILLEAFARGEAPAFTTIYQKYSPVFYAYGKQLVGDHAPDIVADVFEALWTLKKRFDSEAHLYSYLRSMVRNACFHFLTRQERESHLLEDFIYISEQAGEDAYLKEIIHSRMLSLILEDIEQLPLHLRQVFKLAYLGEFKNAEIAAMLHLKESSVRSCKAQALHLLRIPFSLPELILLFHPIVIHILENSSFFYLTFLLFCTIYY